MLLPRLQDGQVTVQDRGFKESGPTWFIAAFVPTGVAAGMYLWSRLGDLRFFFVVVFGRFSALFSLICFGCFDKAQHKRGKSRPAIHDRRCTDKTKETINQTETEQYCG